MTIMGKTKNWSLQAGCICSPVAFNTVLTVLKKLTFVLVQLWVEISWIKALTLKRRLDYGARSSGVNHTLLCLKTRQLGVLIVTCNKYMLEPSFIPVYNFSFTHLVTILKQYRLCDSFKATKKSMYLQTKILSKREVTKLSVDK